MRYLIFLFVTTFFFSCSSSPKEQAPPQADTIAPPTARTELPASLNNNRFLVQPRTDSGDTLSFLVDTGGGFSMLWKSTASRLGLASGTAVFRDDTVNVVSWPAMDGAAMIPQEDRKLALYERPEEALARSSGILGSHWLEGRIWEFDYANQRLYHLEELDWSKRDPAKRVKLHFKKVPQGSHPHIHPRLPVVVDGDTLQMVFDTGAQTALSDNAKYAVSPENNFQQVGMNFIMRSVFLKWRETHEDWKVIEEGDKGYNDTPLIRVPSVTIAGQESGAVWFAVRDDRIYNHHMLQMMDAPVHGTLGGEALRYFTIIADYRSGQAEFTRNAITN